MTKQDRKQAFIQIEAVTGCKFDNEKDFLLYVYRALEWLESHNKNYTKEQYQKIQDLKNFFDIMADAALSINE